MSFEPCNGADVTMIHPHGWSQQRSILLFHVILKAQLLVLIEPIHSDEDFGGRMVDTPKGDTLHDVTLVLNLVFRPQ